MKKIVSILTAVVLLVCTLIPVSYAATPAEDAKLSFGEDGKFRILQLSDFQDNASLSALTKDFIKESVKTTNPDLIVLTGDNIAGYGTYSAAQTEKAIRQVMDTLETLGVPVALVFGNHDDQSTKLSKEDEMKIYSEYSCCIAYDEGEAISGCGTYNVPIYSSKDDGKVVFNVWMFDSGSYDSTGAYDHVKQDQLDWYVKTSNELKAQNDGNTVYSLAFQHIIVPEIYDALTETSSTASGAVIHNGKYYVLPETAAAGSIMGESPCPSGTNGGEFEAFKAQGDVLAIGTGHDHTNSFVVPYEGIDLVNTPTCGFYSYGNAATRGGRIFDISESDTSTYTTSTVLFTDLFADNATVMAQYNFVNFFKEIELFFNNLWVKITNIFSK